MRQESVLCFSLLFVLLAASFFVLYSYEETLTGLVGANVTFAIVSAPSAPAEAAPSTTGGGGGGGGGGGKVDEEEEEEEDGLGALSSEFFEERETVFYVEDAFTFFGASFSDLRVGDTLYFGSSVDGEDLAFLEINAQDLDTGEVHFLFTDLLQESSSYTLVAGESLALDIDKDGLDEYVLVFQGAAEFQLEFFFKRVVQISFALFGAPVVIPVVLHRWLVFSALILFVVILGFLLWWARRVF